MNNTRVFIFCIDSHSFFLFFFFLQFVLCPISKAKAKIINEYGKDWEIYLFTFFNLWNFLHAKFRRVLLCHSLYQCSVLKCRFTALALWINLPSYIHLPFVGGSERFVWSSKWIKLAELNGLGLSLYKRFWCRSAPQTFIVLFNLDIIFPWYSYCLKLCYLIGCLWGKKCIADLCCGKKGKTLLIQYN